MNTADLVFWPAALAAMALAAASDLKRRLIPNFLVLIVLCAGLGLRINGGVGATGLSLAATAIVTGILYVMADRKYMGWGDAKMIAAASLLVPPHAVTTLIFYIVFAGGLLSCFYVLARLALRHTPRSTPAAAALSLPPGSTGLWQRERTRIVARESMPYCIAILGGTCFWLLNQVMKCSFATSC